MAGDDQVRNELDRDEATVAGQEERSSGPIGAFVSSFTTEAENLLGFVLQMSYDEATIVTCDAWKRKCGGVPKNSFVAIRMNSSVARLNDRSSSKPILILARVLEAVGTPLSHEIQQTIFSIHKVQAVVDPYTNAELQWSALRVSVLGTYYDEEDHIQFGNDIDSYVSPHFYEVYVPPPEMLEELIDSFVSEESPFIIGHLRFTETKTSDDQPKIPVKVSPADFISNRTALFGKTRMGKSNTIKVIADMMIQSPENVGQIVFDLNGEYSNWNEADNTSIFDLHQDDCVRFSLNPHSRTAAGVPNPSPLLANFYEQILLGHTIMYNLWDQVHSSRPGYLIPLLDWSPVDAAGVETTYTEIGDRKRYIRARSMYFAALHKANFDAPRDLMVDMVLNAEIRRRLLQNADLARVAQTETVQSGSDTTTVIADRQPVSVATRIYETLFTIHRDSPNDADLFPSSRRTGDPYFDPIHISLLKIIGDRGVLGARYLTPFNDYHSSHGIHIVEQVVALANEGKTVLIDLANADEVVAGFFSNLICVGVFRSQTQKFTSGDFGNHSILFYFEEAHNLFRRDDKDLRSIYNRLAKEGGKYRIGMVYATQSMTTLSPDLMKNTENFFIAHLNDSREINELTTKYEFKDIALDVQRSRTKGYVRMITLSQRFALPVQILKFERPEEN